MFLWLHVIFLTQSSEIVYFTLLSPIYHIGCDNSLCHSTCEGVTFQGFVIGRLGWSKMERPCAKLCTMSPFTCR